MSMFRRIAVPVIAGIASIAFVVVETAPRIFP